MNFTGAVPAKRTICSVCTVQPPRQAFVNKRSNSTQEEKEKDVRITIMTKNVAAQGFSRTFFVVSQQCPSATNKREKNVSRDVVSA